MTSHNAYFCWCEKKVATSATSKNFSFSRICRDCIQLVSVYLSYVLVGWLTNWLSTFDCLQRIDLCMVEYVLYTLYELWMWIHYFNALGTHSICLLFLIYYHLVSHRIQFDWNIYIECFYFHSIFFYSILIFNTCNRIKLHCPILLQRRARTDVGVSVHSAGTSARALVPIHTMSNNRSWCWNVRMLLHYNVENDNKHHQSCNRDWMYFDYQFLETVHSFVLCGCSMVWVICSMS